MAVCLYASFGQISHGNEPCTVGVDAASVLAPLERFAQQPVATEASNILVGFVDVEGQGDKGQAYDVQLLCPLLLVSRVAIFNWRGKVQKDDLLEKLKVNPRSPAGGRLLTRHGWLTL